MHLIELLRLITIISDCNCTSREERVPTVK